MHKFFIDTIQRARKKLICTLIIAGMIVVVLFQLLGASASTSDTAIDTLRNKTCLDIDQLRTFYDYKNDIYFKVLIVPQIQDGQKIMEVFILDNANNVKSQLEVWSNAPMLYYDNFIDMEYTDINKDGYCDLKISANFSTGMGPDGTTPTLHSIVYLKEGDKFTLSVDFTE